MDDQPPAQPPQQQQQHEDRATSDADKIRAKRLAKLGGSSGSGESRPQSTAPVPSPAPPAVSPPSSSQPPAPMPSPFSQFGMTPEGRQQAPKINIRPANSNPPVPASSPAPSQPKSKESLEDWTDRTLSSVFRISLDSSRASDAHGHRLCFLSDTRDELENEDSPIRLTTDRLDSVLVEAATKTRGKSLDYLLGCWKRVSRLYRSGIQKTDPKFEVVKEARRFCFSYAIFAATLPDMFGEDAAMGNGLAEYLLVDPENDRGICLDFLSEAVARFDEDESIKELLVGAMESISGQLAKISMNGDYRPYMVALRNFVRYPALLAALVESPMFLPSGVEPQHIETRTLLGPFFRLSPMQGEVARNYFSSATTRDKAYVANSQRALRMALQTHQDELFDVANAFIKTTVARNKMLNWFALTVNANHKRRAMQVDPKTVSSDAFMVNITIILDRLCDPFMDAQFGKIDRIDIDYLRRSPRVDIKDETKINADQSASDVFYNVKAEGTNNFITEIFFLTVAAHHYGTEAANTKLSTLQREVKYLEKQLAKYETERHKYTQNPAQLALFDAHVKKIKDQVERGQCVILATQGALLDETAQARSMQFMRYVIVWLLRLVSPSFKSFSNAPKLPLPQEQPAALQCLPEYFLEDIVDNFKFITRWMPHIITSTQCEELMMICIVFLRSSEYIKNPYLKSGLITILFHGVWEIPGRSKGVLGDVLFAHKFATKHLLHSLMKFYIECESTGAHTQFYDKFNIRYEIFQVIKCIWPNPVYRENLAEEARVNLDFFVQFVNLLLNDVTFVLDESFTAFTQIHDISKLLRNPPEDMDANVRQEQEEKLSSAQSKAKSYMQLTNETVAMLKLFTEALSDSFTKKEVVVRLAHMLDYNLDALVGPKKSNLKVENPDEYGWNPRQMLSEIADVYLNLKDKKTFIDAVATDGRSYRPEHFTQALTIMERFALKSPEQLSDWKDLATRVESAKEEAEMEEADLGDIPDEYVDPILATLMEDPVILPRSKQIVDRSTIRSHLLSDPNDPFNRTPLAIDQVIDNTELREQIQGWKAQKLAEKLAERKAAKNPEADVMDTS